MYHFIRSQRLFLLFCLLFIGFSIGLQHHAVAAPVTQADSPLEPPPANDNFDQATTITLPFSQYVDTTWATLEVGEAHPSCASDEFHNSVWFRFTADVDDTLVLNTWWNVPYLVMYAGDAIDTLQELYCFHGPYLRGLPVSGGTTYYIQLAGDYNNYFATQFEVYSAPDPTVEINYSPDTPAKQSSVYFYGYVYDVADMGVSLWSWDFGDGTTATADYIEHTYAQDGDYTVTLDIVTNDGRTASATRTVSVRTYDVAIIQVSRPNSARAGTTKQIVVSVENASNSDYAWVELYKSQLGGFSFVGSQRQLVVATPSGAVTKFYMGYTFTDDDAAVGKVVFKAVAYPEHYDYFPADNEFITFATKVTPARVRGATDNDVVSGAALDEFADYNTDTMSNVEFSFSEAGMGTVSGLGELVDGQQEAHQPTESFKMYLPAINR